MNLQELTTWNRLLAVDLDAADSALPFSARLARDNGWPRDFAARAIEEYRKFCFLVVHAGHAVTPSDEVDQVWHLHLLYSRHYWEALCRDALERPLHHGPTAGGPAEGRKYRSWYEDTLASYRRYFGEPPQDLWPASDERFDAAHDFVRVDRRDVVTLGRAALKRGALATLAGSGVLAVAHAFAQAESGPASGSGFGVALILAIVVGALILAAARGGRGHGARTSARRVAKGRADKRKGGRAAAAGAAAPVGGDSSKNGPDGDSPADAGPQGCGTPSGCGGAGSGCGGGGCGGS